VSAAGDAAAEADGRPIADRLAALERRVRELEDREEIFALVATYHRSCDGGWGHLEDGLVAATVGEARGTHDGDRVAELFVEDGTYSAIHPEAGRHPHFPGAHGRENIRALVNSWRDAEWTIHYSTNPIIRVDGDRATGEFKGVMWLSLDQVRPMHVIYRGDFVRTADGWRIQSFRWLNANPPVGAETAAEGADATR
jgi:SnoaL-like domain